MRFVFIISAFLLFSCNKHTAEGGYIQPRKKMPGITEKTMHRPNVNKNRYLNNQ
jgi:hypothetical protein